MPTRVAAYIDGFNLCHGLKDKHGRKYLWLDLQALAASLLLPDQTLVAVRYFSARVRGEASARRQGIYLDALDAHCPLVEIREGRFRRRRAPAADAARSTGRTKRRRRTSASRSRYSRMLSRTGTTPPW